jgi:hypothetical protein
VCHQRLVVQLVGEIETTIGHRDALDDEPRQAGVFLIGLAFRQAFEQRREVVPALLVKGKVQHRGLEARFGESPGAIDQAA